MFVKADFTLNEFYKEIIEDELNVKEVTFTDDVSELTTYNFKPQLKTVGPKYGKQLGGIKEYLANVDGNKAMAELKSNGAIKFDVDGTEISLAEEDLLIEMTQKEGYVTEADNYVTVVLDTNLTDELLEEGSVNEIISKLQTMRKDSGFEVMDRIKLYIDGNDKLAEIIKKNEAAIAGKVLANEVIYNTKNDQSKEWNINGEKISLGVERV
jgi:isoleucyl-tRNA synthetase